MLARFTFYDFLAVLIPGVFLLWAAGQILGPGSPIAVVSAADGIGDTSVLVVVGYIVGLLLHALGEATTEKLALKRWGGFPSARWLLPDDTTISAEQRADLGRALQARFAAVLPTDVSTPAMRSEAMKRNQEIFFRCYRAVEKVSEMPQIFNAQYGLFRSLVTLFVLLLALALGRVGLAALGGHLPPQDLLAWLGFLLAADWLAWRRMRKRGEDYARSVLDAFLAQPGAGAGG